jgi:glycerol dehydrogenase
MSIKIQVSPQRYVQGPGALAQIGNQLNNFGISNPLILASPSALKACQEILSQGLESSGKKTTFVEFNRECTFEEIQRVKDICLKANHDAIINCGGGKVLDTGRAAAAGFAINVSASPPEIFNSLGANVPCIQIPTVASSDAATASASVVYTKEGETVGFVMVQRHPIMVLVDTNVILQAPVRTLVAGMGDALATYFEAETCYKAGLPSITGGLSTRTTLLMTKLCLDTLLEFGLQAKREADEKICGPALESIVEANILMSGLGYENGGLAAAHALATSLTSLYNRFDPQPFHGELVAFSTLAQLIMEKRDNDTIREVIRFCREVGLPLTFEGIGLKNIIDDELKMIAVQTAKSILMRPMPGAFAAPDDQGCFYDPDIILDSLKKADSRGQG